METALVTGGAGFIGSNIAEAMALQGYRVVILDDLSTGRIENIEEMLGAGHAQFVQGSVLDTRLLREVIRSNCVSVISHQAAIPSVEKSVLDPVSTAEANITGTANLFQIAAESGCRRIVFASSSAIYGDAPELPKVESMPFRPKSPYAVSKITKELFARVFSELHGIEIVGLRYFNVYGRRQDPSSDYAAVIPKFIAGALANTPITIEGDGLQTRDFAYIDDVVKANINAFMRGGVSGKVFNIACGSSISIIDLARMIIGLTASASTITYLPPRAGDIRDSRADIEHARKYLGFNPEYDIAAGLRKTVQWFRETLQPEPDREPTAALR